MTDPVETVCNLTGCTEEQARQVLNETKDIIEAVDRLLEKKPSPAEKFLFEKKRPRETTPEEQIIRPIRTIMKELDEKTSTLLYRPVREELNEMRDHHEEMALQNSCFQECQLPSLQSEAQIQETACQSQSGCSYDSQLNDQTLLCSDHQYPQSYQVQEMA
jgi:hypothetical protein